MKENITTMVKYDKSIKTKLSKIQKKSRKAKINCKADMDKYRIINCKYKLSPIIPKSTPINQRNMYIVCEFIFNSHDLSNETWLKDPQEVQKTSLPFFHQINFKKIQCYVYDPKVGLSRYYFINRWDYVERLTSQVHKEVVMDILTRSTKSTELSEIQENYTTKMKKIMAMKKIDKLMCKGASGDKKLIVNNKKNMYGIDLIKDNKKFFYKIKNDDDLKQLRNYAFFCLEYYYSNNEQKNGIINFSHNNEFSELVSQKRVQLDRTDDGFEILSNLISDDCISLYTKMVKLYLTSEYSNCLLSKSELYVQLKTGKILNGHFILYKNGTYQSDDSYVVEMYFFYQADQPKILV